MSKNDKGGKSKKSSEKSSKKSDVFLEKPLEDLSDRLDKPTDQTDHVIDTKLANLPKLSKKYMKRSLKSYK